MSLEIAYSFCKFSLWNKDKDSALNLVIAILFTLVMMNFD